MANSIITVTFAKGRNNLGIDLVVRTKYENGKDVRHYKRVENLENPNLNSWDKKTARFTDVTLEAVHNNELLAKLISQYQEFIKTGVFEDGKQLLAHDLNKPVQTYTPVTLGEFLKELIQKMKTESVKMPSKNYQCYITLLHKLELEKQVINTPLNEFDNKAFKKFAAFILNELGGVNYLSLMVRLKSTLNKAREILEDVPNITYAFRKDAPRDAEKDAKEAKEGVNVLSTKQYENFCKLDLSTVPHSNNSQLQFMELYRDFCIFLYETKSRPVDVIKMKLENIHGDRLIYFATKKKNYLDSKGVIDTEITPIARKIIQKYKGQSSKGYIFPFAMNEYDWIFKDSKSFNKWNNRKAATLERINKFLHKTGVILKANDLTSYVFRHSTFTHKLNAGMNVYKLAKEGGTSPEILFSHYYNHIKN